LGIKGLGIGAAASSSEAKVIRGVESETVIAEDREQRL
jgi:hypothetical protein